MSLEENIITKMQMFHDILGEDSKFLTEDEEVSTHELFRRMTTIIEDEDTYMFAKLESIDENPSEEAENRLKKDLNNIYAQQFVMANSEIIRNMSKIKNNKYTFVADSAVVPESEPDVKAEAETSEDVATNVEETPADETTSNTEKVEE